MEWTKTERDLREQFEDNLIQFVMTELDTATTFCDLAETASDPERKRRNVENARVGYDTAIRFSKKVHFDRRSRDEFDAKVDHVRQQLKSLGQTV